jgi:hypothetical protein
MGGLLSGHSEVPTPQEIESLREQALKQAKTQSDQQDATDKLAFYERMRNNAANFSPCARFSVEKRRRFVPGLIIELEKQDFTGHYDGIFLTVCLKTVEPTAVSIPATPGVHPGGTTVQTPAQ